jgi:hypothetical protein
MHPPPSSATAPTEELVPATKQKGISNYADLLSLARQFHLGDEASRDLFGKAAGLILKVKPILLRHATEPDGRFHKAWNSLSPIRHANIIRDIHKVAPWLQRFEEAWATKWIARRLINQRVHDHQRSKRKERELERETTRQLQEEEAAWVRDLEHEAANAVVEGKISYNYFYIAASTHNISRGRV